MVLLSQQVSQEPVGGSSFGGSFKENRAFSGYMYRAPGGAVEKDTSAATKKTAKAHYAIAGRPEAKEGRFASAFAESSARLDAPVTSMRDRIAGSSSTTATGAAQGFLQYEWEETFKRRHDFVIPTSRTAYKPLWDFDSGEKGPSIEGVEYNPQWYPHPSLQRGKLLLSVPRAIAYGVDPLKYKVNEDPFWHANNHRFRDVAEQPESKPILHEASRRWDDEEAWQNPRNHAALKITHTEDNPLRKY